MQRLLHGLASLVLFTQVAGCVSYSSIQKVDDKIYLSGAKSFWFVNIAFLKRCDLEGQVLKCEELKEFKPEPAAATSGPGAGTSDAATDATTPAPPPEEKKAPAKAPEKTP